MLSPRFIPLSVFYTRSLQSTVLNWPGENISAMITYLNCEERHEDLINHRSYTNQSLEKKNRKNAKNLLSYRSKSDQTPVVWCALKLVLVRRHELNLGQFDYYNGLRNVPHFSQA